MKIYLTNKGGIKIVEEEFFLKKGEHKVVNNVTGEAYFNRDEAIVSMFNSVIKKLHIIEKTLKESDLKDLEDLIMENDQLRSEINMLRISLSRKEAYIKILTDSQMD